MKKYLLGLLALGTFAAPASAAPLLFDGFETPFQNGGYSYGGTNGLATFSDLTGLQGNGSAFGYAAAPEGVQTAHIQGQGTITYNLTGLSTSNQYSLSFFTAARSGYPVGSFTVSFANVILGTFTPGSTSFISQTVNFNPISSAGSLVFTGTNASPSQGNDQNSALDAVSLSAVPEPATWAMMLMGFGMVGFGLRSRRKPTVRVTYA